MKQKETTLHCPNCGEIMVVHDIIESTLTDFDRVMFRDMIVSDSLEARVPKYKRNARKGGN